MKCSCNKCGAEVPTSPADHFTSEEGKILCTSCSIGVTPCSDRIKEMLISDYKG